MTFISFGGAKLLTKNILFPRGLVNHAPSRQKAMDDLVEKIKSGGNKYENIVNVNNDRPNMFVTVMTANIREKPTWYKTGIIKKLEKGENVEVIKMVETAAGIM